MFRMPASKFSIRFVFLNNSKVEGRFPFFFFYLFILICKNRTFFSSPFLTSAHTRRSAIVCVYNIYLYTCPHII